MAGGAKKKKKPAANPARGFATTSIASKPRPEISDTESKPSPSLAPSATSTPQNASAATSTYAAPGGNTPSNDNTKSLSPEEFEKRLEESELQLIVDKYAQKTKRDAQRQRSRLETDRRLLRSQADSVNSSKWLPPDLIGHVLDLIRAESRFPASSLSSETSWAAKLSSEEDMIARLWTLRQTLVAAGFKLDHVNAAVQYILDTATHVSHAARDSIWGLEEALDYLARDCPADDLPPYEARVRVPKDAPSESNASNYSNSPRSLGSQRDRRRDTNKKSNSTSSSLKEAPQKKTVATCDSDIEPDELVPCYIETKSKLLYLERGPRQSQQGNESLDGSFDMEQAKLEAKLLKVETDVLFDKVLADHQWKSRRVILEKELASARKEARHNQDLPASTASNGQGGRPPESVNEEAERITAELLDDAANYGNDIAGLFDSLPQNEVDPITGVAQTVMNSSDGTRTIIRDFGAWAGVSPKRILEEACRSRDGTVELRYNVVSEAVFANRHSLDIFWTKPQELPPPPTTAEVELIVDPNHFTLTMLGVATPTPKQSEAFIAASALFHIFSNSSREEKVRLKLPPIWRDLWSEMASAKKNSADERDRAIVRSLRDIIRKRRDQELEDGVILQRAFRGRNNGKSAPESNGNETNDLAKNGSYNSDVCKAIWADKTSSHKFQAMLQSRMQLPMWAFKTSVLNAVDQNQVVIICGETGCGKSTQVPSFLLENELSQGKPCKIYCTEPRRISAISLARRVSEELGENRADLGTSRSLVGYSIRLEANTSKETRLVYATTGIVMRMLEGSHDLSGITHLILDEVHERSIDSDFLLIVLRRLLSKRKDLKVILMSATVDAKRFSAYLGSALVLNVPGRTYPVEVRYLEDAIELTGYAVSDTPVEKMVDLDDDTTESEGDRPKSEMSKGLASYSAKTRKTLSQLDEFQIEYDLIVKLIAQIAVQDDLQPYSKAILVFLPGIAEIRTLNDFILGDPRFMKNWLVYPLHSTIATEDQELAFLIPPLGVRKIVLATNIAETGITIPDVTCVIDTGKHREMRFDERRQLSRLIDTFISKANAKQRRGRAGRVQNGLCFHLFTKYRHDHLLADQQTPEMLRLSLQDLAIRVKICKIGSIDETLGEALDAPSAKNIRRAIDALIDVRALTAAEELTPLGHQLARLPLDVFLGKLILLGTVFKCLDMAITVAAILSSKSPFSAPFGQRPQADKARASFGRADSDLLTIYNAYLAWKRVCEAGPGVGKEFQFCRKNFLSQQTLANIEDLKGQLIASLADSGFLSLTDDERKALNRLRFSSGGRGRRQQHFFNVPHRVNINSDNDIVSASVIAWSFYPRLLVRDTPGTKGLRNIGNNQAIRLHPTSVNRNNLDLKWLSYYHIMQSRTVYQAHETTAVEAFAIALLCGEVRCDMYSGVIVLDGNRARFAVPDWTTMLVIKVLRTRLREVLTRSFKQPGKLPTIQQQKWLDVWQRLFSQDSGASTGQDRRLAGVVG